MKEYGIQLEAILVTKMNCDKERIRAYKEYVRKCREGIKDEEYAPNPKTDWFLLLDNSMGGTTWGHTTFIGMAPGCRHIKFPGPNGLGG